MESEDPRLTPWTPAGERLPKVKAFFKYYRPDIVKSVLQTGEVWWSCPLEFNDPLDMQRALHFGQPVENFMEHLLHKLAEFVIDGSSPSSPFKEDLQPTIEVLRKLSVFGESNGISRESRITMLQGQIRTDLVDFVTQLAANVKKAEQIWFNYVRQSRVFCVVDTHDSLPMWAHYAENHTGAVFSIRATDPTKHRLYFARPIRYKTTPPLVASFDQLLNNFLSGQRIPFENFFPDYAYTKGEDWKYEHEWRCHVHGEFEHQSEPCRLKLHPDEIETIYIGCRATEEFERTITELTKLNFPGAKIVKMRVSSDRYAVESKI